MIQRQYHYLIAGLPNISLSDPREWISVTGFKDLLRDHLHPEDFRQVWLVFLKEDHRNLIRFLSGAEAVETGAGNFSFGDFKEQINLFSAILPSEDILPPYMVEVLRENHTNDEKRDPVLISHALAEGFYSFIMSNGCSFLKSFYEFDYNMNNLVAFLKASKFLSEGGKYITGRSQHAVHLQNLEGKSLVKDPEFEYFDEIISISGTASFAEEELKYDRLRWRVIEELVFFEDFSIDRVLGYLQQMLIISRWSALDSDFGVKKLRNFIDRSWDTILNTKQSLSENG
jgi:hypothetical protein